MPPKIRLSIDNCLLEAHAPKNLSGQAVERQHDIILQEIARKLEAGDISGALAIAARY